MAFVHRTCCLTLLVVLAGRATVCGQESARKAVLPSLDSQVAARLLALEKKLDPTNSPERVAGLVGDLAAPPLHAFAPILGDPRNLEIWEQMAEEYYRMTQDSGDSLVTIADPKGVGLSSEQVRRLCHRRLAALPKAALETYRQRVDAEARALLEQGKRTRSPVPLRRLVDDLFCSTPGDQALDLLGDLCFERGNFEEARHWWSLLVPLDGARAHRLVFPRPQVDLARVHAKQILALIFAGRLDEASVEIGRFTHRYPQTKGSLAGLDGAYHAILQKSLNAFAKDRPGRDEPWTTFGGAATRNRPLPHTLSPRLWDDGPAWRVALPRLDAGKHGCERDNPIRRVAFHPVIVNGQVLIGDHRSVVSYDLKSGKELFGYDLKTAGLVDVGPGIESANPLPRFTLSADHDRAYVRLGRVGAGPKKLADVDDVSYLVCLDLTEPGKNKLRQLWQVTVGTDERVQTFFEGAPLVHDDRIYIALSKIVSRHVVTSIVCYDRHGKQRWAREVCDCPEFEDNGNGPRYRQHLLTWSAGQIVYCSHAGAIVAVDAWTGQPTWAVRYPSHGHPVDTVTTPRELVPCVYADGRLFASPVDIDRLFCMDAVTGRVQWELEGIEIVHVLGVANGRLLAATRTGLVSVDAATGAMEWIRPSGDRLPSLGRGLIAGNWLLWPTQDAKLPVRAVTLRSGDPADFDPTSLYTLPVGNYAYGQGCLAIAGLRELVVYVPGHAMDQLPPPDVRLQAQITRDPWRRIR